MLHFPRIQFHFELFSIIVGFLLAFLVQWIISRIRKIMPAVKTTIKQTAEETKERQHAGAEEQYDQYAYLHAQRFHLASSLFPLKSILIDPVIIPPLAVNTPGESPISQPRIHQLVPLTPDWPELSSTYTTLRISLLDALQSGNNLMLVGLPGVGKTTALAAFAAQMTKKKAGSDHIAPFLPVMVHISDLDYRGKLEKVIDQIYETGTSFLPSKIRHFAFEAFESRLKLGKLVVLLDGLDELPPADLDAACAFIKALLQQSPKIRLITTATPFYSSSLTSLGIEPVTLAAWNKNDLNKFLDHWDMEWKKIQPVDNEELDQRLIRLWLENEKACQTPLETTLRVWGAYSGSLSGGSLNALVDSCVTGILEDSNIDFLSKFCWDGISHNQYPIRMNTIDPNATHKLEVLNDAGILIQHSNNFSFISPIFASAFAARRDKTLIESNSREPSWCTAEIINCLRLGAAAQDSTIASYLNKDIQPLFLKLNLLARYLRDYPQGTARNFILRQIVNIIQNDAYPLGLRSGFAVALVNSGDPGAQVLFRQCLRQGSPATRTLGALISGFTQDVKTVDDLLHMTQDQSESVRCSASVALTRLGTASAMQAAARVFLSGEERAQLVVAEAFAGIPGEGHEILKEAVTYEDILVRRAAVVGLGQIQEEWVKPILETVSVDDKQWVVRNVAVQALENLQTNKLQLSAPLPPADSNQWLLGKASKRGEGISKGEIPVDLMLDCLKNGDDEEKIYILKYLRDNPSSGVISAIYGLFFGEETSAREAAYITLWYMAMSKSNLPNPVQFGFQ